MYVCLHVCTSIYAILLQCLCCLLLPRCILVSVVVLLCLSCLLVSCMPLCILVSVVVPLVSCMSACCLFVFLCLVCLLAVCLFVLSCATHDCACACLVCLLVFAPPPCTSNSNTTVATVVRPSIAMYFGLCKKKQSKSKNSWCAQLWTHQLSMPNVKNLPMFSHCWPMFTCPFGL